MRFVRHAVPILSLLFVAVPLAAQNGTIRGQVVDSSTRQALAGVSIQIQGTPRVTTSAPDGSYSLGDVPAGSVVVRATRIGFGPRQQVVTVSAGGTVEAQFELSPQASLLDAVVVTGYGTQRREAITGSVASVDPSSANVGVKTNVTQLIQGRAAGVEVIQNNGEPGAGAQVLIRGGSSFNAKNDPLYVIDGVPINNIPSEPDANGWTGNPSLARNPLNLINPADIASITILKDAASTAIYGSRASNGVILVETKKGQSAGGPTFEYDGYVSTSSPARRLDVLSGSEYANFVRAQVTAGNLDSARLGKIGLVTSTGPNPGDTLRVVYNTNWENAVTRSSVTHNQNLSFAGGSEDTRYRASLNYAREEGVTIANGLERIQGRLSANHSDLDGRLRVGRNVTSSRINNTYITYENQGGFEGGVFQNAANLNPTQPVMANDTTYYEPGGNSLFNPVALANQITDLGKTTRTLANGTAEIDLVPGLTGQVTVGLDYSAGGRQIYFPIANPLGRTLGNGLARVYSQDNNTKTVQTLLTYRKQVGENHSLDVVGGYEYSKFTKTVAMGQGIGFVTDALLYNSLNAAQSLQDSSDGNESRLVSFLSRANYGYKDKFFVTGVLRYDGSSKFAEGHKWALFPGLSASWHLTQEGFLRGGPFSDLRLRIGWGRQGNPGIKPYQSLRTLVGGTSAAYPWSDVLQAGVIPNSVGTPTNVAPVCSNPLISLRMAATFISSYAMVSEKLVVVLLVVISGVYKSSIPVPDGPLRNS